MTSHIRETVYLLAELKESGVPFRERWDIARARAEVGFSAAHLMLLADRVHDRVFAAAA